MTQIIIILLFLIVVPILGAGLLFLAVGSLPKEEWHPERQSELNKELNG